MEVHAKNADSSMFPDQGNTCYTGQLNSWLQLHGLVSLVSSFHSLLPSWSTSFASTFFLTWEVIYCSVFPAEACETIGGEACDVEMYPEVKPKPEAQGNKDKTASEQIDREYLEYNNPKT